MLIIESHVIDCIGISMLSERLPVRNEVRRVLPENDEVERIRFDGFDDRCHC